MSTYREFIRAGWKLVHVSSTEYVLRKGEGRERQVVTLSR